VTDCRYLAPARRELRNAAYYYKERSPRVAATFMASVQSAIDDLVAFPESATVVKGAVRGKIVPRFPYTLMYRRDGDVIVILAVAHHKQRPEYWIDRTDRND